MKKKFALCLVAWMAMLPTSRVFADPSLPIPLTFQDPYEDPGDDNGHHRTTIPIFYLVGHTLTASSYTVGSTVQLLDENDNVVFSTYIFIEGDIQLPSSLSGNYTIVVTRGDQTFEGEIELE